LDEFLAQEQLGNKLQPRLEGDTPNEKLDTIRRALKEGDDEDAKRRKEALLNRVYKDDAPILMPVDIDEKKEKWDCETILSKAFVFLYLNISDRDSYLQALTPISRITPSSYDLHNPAME
jgi:hypothetical protein